MLEVREVSRDFGGLRALANVTLRVEEKRIYGLIGPNGAGKTTLFNLITGLIPVSQGSLRFRGVELTRLPPHRIAKLGIARTFQNIRLFPTMTVLENVLVAQNTHAQSGIASLLPFSGPRERQWKEEVDEILRQMGLLERRHEGSTSLAYGEQRRLEIARALALQPSLLLLDEPAAGMNEAETEDLLERIQKLQDMGKTILLIEHDMNLVMEICHHIFVLNFGEVIAAGKPTEIQANEDVIEAYLGREEG